MKATSVIKLAQSACAAILVAACSPNSPPASGEAENEVVNVYSARHYDSDRVMYQAFEEETGIRVRFREAGAAQLLETMRAEGASSPADVVIASDAGALWRFEEAGLLQTFASDAVDAAIPSCYREPSGLWTGLARRVRVIAYDPERISADLVDDYLDLADPALQGEVCMRSSSNVYNLSLFGDLMERVGSEAAETWAEGVVANFARDPKGGDTSQIDDIAAGACGVSLINHYYWVRMAENGSPAQKAAAERVALSFPQTGGSGVHVNVTGAGLAAHAPNAANAVRFIEFLASSAGQSLLVDETKEFPIVDGATQPAGLERMPDFEQAGTALSVYGENQAAAQAAYDRAGWK